MCPVFSLEHVPTSAHLMVAPPTPTAQPYQAGVQLKSGSCPKVSASQRPTGQERGEGTSVCVQTQALPCNSSISAEQFKHLLQSLLPSLSPPQYNALMAKVTRREGRVSMNYQDFNRGRFSDCPPHSQRGGARSRGSSVAEQSSRTLHELQQGLKHQIEANLKGVMRAFRLYDYNRDGQIQRHELRRLLDNYLPMSDVEFKRLWSYCYPNNFAMMPYKEFLMKLGINCEMYTKFVPQPRSLVVDSQASEGDTKRREKETPYPLTPEKTQEVFLNKMRQSYSEVWRVLLAFDVTCSGVLPLEDLHTIINNFLFPMSLCTFQSLLRRLGVRPSKTVHWKNFMMTVRDTAHREAKPKQDKDITDQRPSAPSRTASQREMRECSSDQVEQKDESKAVRTAWTENSTLAAATWTTVEELLRDKLSKSSVAVNLALGQLDRRGRGTVRQEELRKVIQQHGLPLSDQHFNRLCELCTESGRVRYKHFLQRLGVPASDGGTSSNLKTQCAKDRRDFSSGPHEKKADDLLWRLQERLSLISLTLSDCLPPAATKPSGTLTVSEFRKILQDYKLPVDERQLQTLTRVLGFRDGKIFCSELLSKYSGSLASYQRRAPMLNKPEAGAPPRLLTAEDCLSLMSDRITEVHGSLLSAFRLMDKDRDSFVHPCDYQQLHKSLGFVTKDSEYNRLLRLVGFGPGKRLSYPEFQSIVQSKGKKLALQPANGLEQLHQTLVTNAVHRWPDMSRKLSHYGDDGVQIVLKNDFKNLVFSFGLPVTPEELQALWLRYDPKGKGYIILSEFQEKLKLDPTNEIGRPAHVISFNSADSRPGQSGVSLKDIGDVIRRQYHELSSALTRQEMGRDGRVRLEDLLRVLQQHGCSVEREQLTLLLHSLKVKVVAGSLPWLSFLRAFELGPAQQLKAGCSTPSPSPTENLEALSPERAIQRISELVTTSLHTLHKVFSSFDRDGRGTLSSPEFRRVLELFCARLSDSQYRCLLSRLVLDWENNAVCWRNFLHKFNLNNKAPERKLIMETKAYNPVQFQSLPDSKILECVHGVVSERLFSITMEMVDMDPTNCGTISKDDFRDISEHNLHFLSPEQFEWLWEQLPLTERGDLDYRTFLKCFSVLEPCLSPTPAAPSVPDLAINPGGVEAPLIPPRPKTAELCGSHISKFEPGQRRRPRSSPLLNCGATERRIQGRVRCCWKEIQRRCRLEDQQRCGQISQRSFMEILKDLQIHLSDQEFKELALKYDIQESGQLSYPDFLRHFVLFLHPQPKQAFEQAKLPTLNAQTLEIMSDQSVEALLRMSESVQQCWKSMRQSFAVQDPDRRGTISFPVFRKVLRQHSVNLSENEFLHLAACFEKDAGGRISYNDFLRTFLG